MYIEKDGVSRPCGICRTQVPRSNNTVIEILGKQIFFCGSPSRRAEECYRYGLMMIRAKKEALRTVRILHQGGFTVHAMPRREVIRGASSVDKLRSIVSNIIEKLTKMRIQIRRQLAAGALHRISVAIRRLIDILRLRSQEALEFLEVGFAA